MKSFTLTAEEHFDQNNLNRSKTNQLFGQVFDDEDSSDSSYYEEKSDKGNSETEQEDYGIPYEEDVGQYKHESDQEESIENNDPIIERLKVVNFEESGNYEHIGLVIWFMFLFILVVLKYAEYQNLQQDVQICSYHS